LTSKGKEDNVELKLELQIAGHMWSSNHCLEMTVDIVEKEVINMINWREKRTIEETSNRKVGELK